MPSTEQQLFVEHIHVSGRQFVLALTGGGSGAIAAMLQVPGASASVLEAVVPYSACAMQEWLGGPVEQYCSEATARVMAMRAFERARELSDADPHTLRGIGATASLATNRPKRGAHRIHIAWQSATATAVASCVFKDPNQTRAAEEAVATQFALYAVAEACDLPVPPVEETIPIDVVHHKQVAPPEWTDLLLGNRASVDVADGAEQTAPRILFPGAFNPPHWGHAEMAEIAARRLGEPVTFELSITNVDKPPLDFMAIANRLTALKDQHVLLTRAPTFVEKSRLAPGCVFVVGADTLERIADPVYYGGSSSQRDDAIAEIADRGCRFLVFARSVEGLVTPLAKLNIPRELRAICDEVPASEFSADVSSTQLRAAMSS
jgi:hypothetical protein